MRAVARCWRELLMLSHRRYTGGNADALASAVTYSLLIASAPVLLLAARATGGDGASGAVARAAQRLAPEPVATVLDETAHHTAQAVALGSWTLLALMMTLWASTRSIRTLRTALRAVCGQENGSGNPVTDNARDVVLAAVLVPLVLGCAWCVARVPETLAPWCAAALLAVCATVALRVLPWPQAGRPSLPLAVAAAVVTTAACALLATVGAHVLEATMPERRNVYGAAAVAVAAALWVALATRALLRSASLASVLTERLSPPPPTDEQSLWVVVPAYREATGITRTLDALARQTDTRFQLVVVDNGSDDGTLDVVRSWARRAAPRFPVHAHVESELRGPGAAFDAGARFAVARGATLLARTDADCLPRPDWVQQVRDRFARGAMVVCGASVPRRDEDPTFAERFVLPAAIRLAALHGRYRRDHRSPEYLAPYVLCHGHNFAIAASVYAQCGGASHTPLETGSEDVETLNRARRVTPHVVRAEDVVVETSLRRLRAWGAKRTLLWQWDRRYVPPQRDHVHIREQHHP